MNKLIKEIEAVRDFMIIPQANTFEHPDYTNSYYQRIAIALAEHLRNGQIEECQ